MQESGMAIMVARRDASIFRVERTVDECLRARAVRRERPYRIAAVAEIASPLEAWMREVEGGDARVENVVRAPGGASKENFFFDLVRGGERRELLLRLDPGESIVETHRLREFQIIRAVEGVVAVPQAIAVDAEGARFGRPSMIMAKVEGRTQPPVSWRPSGVGIAYETELRDALAIDFVESLARLHRLDWRTRDLSAYDVPREGTLEAAAWTLAWWERVYEEDHLEHHPVIAWAAEWLRGHLPVADHVVLVHGDYRSGNFLYAEPGEITAVLDWELAHLGDPHEDLGWVVNDLFSTREADGSRLACGLLPRAAMIERYERATGWTIDPERLRFYEIFDNYKLAVCAQTTSLRIARGRASHLPASMSLIHAFAHRYVAELARALGLGRSTR
jgi:aminoglycoside phosphotransferase (APT) family kinase protein